MVEGNVGGGVHDCLGGLLSCNHGGFLNWEVLLSSVKSADMNINNKVIWI